MRRHLFSALTILPFFWSGLQLNSWPIPFLVWAQGSSGLMLELKPVGLFGPSFMLIAELSLGIQTDNKISPYALIPTLFGRMPFLVTQIVVIWLSIILISPLTNHYWKGVPSWLSMIVKNSSIFWNADWIIIFLFGIWGCVKSELSFFFQYKTYGPIIWWIESKISEASEHATREKSCRLCKLKGKHIMLTTQQIKVSIISSFISLKGLVKL